MKSIIRLIATTITFAGSVCFGQTSLLLPGALSQGRDVDQGKTDVYERREVNELFNWTQEFAGDQLVGNVKKGTSEVLEEVGKTGPAAAVKSVPLSLVDAWLSGLSMLSSEVGNLLPNEFSHDALPIILEAPATGVIVEETFRSESTAPPRLDQPGPAAGVTWQQKDTADWNLMVEASSRYRQQMVNQSSGRVISTISARPATLIAPPKSLSSPIFSDKNCAGGSGPTGACK